MEMGNKIDNQMGVKYFWGDRHGLRGWVRKKNTRQIDTRKVETSDGTSVNE